jgi:hypothetical protein
MAALLLVIYGNMTQIRTNAHTFSVFTHKKKQFVTISYGFIKINQQPDDLIYLSIVI